MKGKIELAPIVINNYKKLTNLKEVVKTYLSKAYAYGFGDAYDDMGSYLDAMAAWLGEGYFNGECWDDYGEPYSYNDITTPPRKSHYDQATARLLEGINSPSPRSSSRPCGTRKTRKQTVQEEIQQEIFERENVIHTVKFYEDITDSSKYKEFENLYEFDNFCTDRGYNVSDMEVQKLMNRHDNHCCIDPTSNVIGKASEIMSGKTYGDLYWLYLDRAKKTKGAN